MYRRTLKQLIIYPICATLMLSSALAAGDPGKVNIKNPPTAQATGVLQLPHQGTTERLSLIPSPPDIDAKAYILIDASSGKVIAEKNATSELPPASLTKLMTLYLAFQALQQGAMQPTTPVPISVLAWRTGGSKMFVREGTKVPAELLIRGIIVDSGNDACVAMSEYLGGSEEAFVGLMNQQAQALGMTHTNFTDSTGMPHPNHYTSAQDMAILTRALIQHFPEYYHHFAEKSLKYNGIKQYNRNRLLWRTNLAVDGLKTGHTQAAGYCLVSSADKDNQRLIAVVMGTKSDNARMQTSAALLTYGFRFFETHKLYGANTPIDTVRVWKGNKKDLPLGVSHDVYASIPKGHYSDIKAQIQLDHTLTAPIEQNQAVGKLNVYLKNTLIAHYPLVALNSVDKGGAWHRFTDSVTLYFKSHFGSDDENSTEPEATTG